MIRVGIAALVLASISLPAGADDNLYSQGYGSCMEASGGVTVEMLDCIAAEHSRQDARLNRAYRALTAQLGADRRKELLAAQRLWIQYRDANCRFYADPDGGTIASINAASCGLEMTARRATELELLAG